jgi:hypothetical protein
VRAEFLSKKTSQAAIPSLDDENDVGHAVIVVRIGGDEVVLDPARYRGRQPEARQPRPTDECRAAGL